MAVERALIPAIEDETSRPKFLASGEPVFREVFLGRKPPTTDMVRRVPRLAQFIDVAAAAALPASTDYLTKARPTIGMKGNDQYGNCVIVGKSHAVGAWSANDAAPINGTRSEAVSEYQRICGPGDNGCYITAVLDEFAKNGIMVGGSKRKIDGYVAVDPKNRELVKAAIYYFGGLTIGFNVPSEWMPRAVEGGLWDVPVSGRFVGGHDVRVIDYNEVGVRLATWGVVLTMTWRALASAQIVDECYVELSPDWYNDDKLAPSGLDVPKLKAALAVIAGGGVPDIEPVPVPPPTPQEPVVYDVKLTGAFPSGVFGGTRPVEITGTATAGGAKAAAFGAVPWLVIARLVAQAFPIVVAGIAAGKTFAQIVADVINALDPKKVAEAQAGLAAAASGMTPSEWLDLIVKVVKIVLSLLGK